MRGQLYELGLASAVILVGVAAWILSPESDDRRFAAPGAERLSAQEFVDESYRLVPLMLRQVYDAFGETDERLLYDRLAEVAAGGALERLYLDRAGAMKGGGLEADQTVHEVALLGLTARQSNGSITAEARWRVLGLVGHAQHMHLRGNVYAAELTLAPVDDAWRLVAFSLTDVDRTDAGTTQAIPAEAASQVRASGE